ncbi:patatin-like phospholipase RssA [Pseudaeromonas sharmana]|uniref:Patatin-like phospholipase RssA n=1 Tax=Pseudaeromonas sharmana TaxID=328412 RepID=A0ABV8CL10_9GAMM
MDRKPLRIGIALGSGAARGWAHIGVLRGLAKLGIAPDLVAGCSIGALVGAAYAAGELSALEEWVRGFTRLQVMTLLDPAFSGGLLRGDKVFGVAEERVGELTFSELKKPFACVATELESGRERWLQQGGVMASVRASCSIPGMFVPVQVDGQWLIDGAVVNPVPISLCRAMGADLVIAVNLNSDSRHAWASRDDEVTPKNPLLQWLAKRNGHGAPGMLGVMNGAISIMQERITRARMAGDPPDIILNPQVGHLAIMDFHRANEAIAEGEVCVERMRPLIEAELRRAGVPLVAAEPAENKPVAVPGQDVNA